MAVSLHNLRYKIAAAAMVKQAAAVISKLPGGTRLVASLHRRIAGDPGEEPTGSYKGILSQILERALPVSDSAEGFFYDPVAGLIPGMGGEGKTLEAAREAVQRNPSAGNRLALAAALRKPYVAEYAEAKDEYINAFRLNPKDVRAVHGIYNTAARSTYDWPEIWSYVKSLKPRNGALPAGASLWDAVRDIFATNPSPSQIEYAIQSMNENRLELVHLHHFLLDVIATRLQLLGYFSEGFHIRAAMAENRVQELQGIPLDNALWLKQLLGAYAYLDDTKKMTAAARRAPVLAATQNDQLRIDKLRADTDLFEGDRTSLVRLAEKRAQRPPQPDELLFDSLVRNKRIAVVGPAATTGNFGAEIDSYDVVVRTQFRQNFLSRHPEQVGTRTDIAYYSGRDLKIELTEAEEAVRSGALKLVVTRPSYLPALDGRTEWLRLAPNEFGLYFRGAPLAVPRIIYDLLQYDPAEIGLFNVDFYTGESLFVDGYRDQGTFFGPGSSLNDVAVVHDLLFEFRATQRFLRTGLIIPRGTTAEVMSLTEDEYVRRLERKSWLVRSSPRGTAH